MKTRPARPEDVDFLVEVFLTSMREAITAARGYWDVRKEDAQFRRQLDLGGTSVIQLADVDVGYVMTRRLDERVTEVHTLCVKADQQGKGLGASIMRELMQRAELAGSALELSVLKANVRAMSFYVRLGFMEIGQSSQHVRMRWPPGA